MSHFSSVFVIHPFHRKDGRIVADEGSRALKGRYAKLHDAVQAMMDMIEGGETRLLCVYSRLFSNETPEWTSDRGMVLEEDWLIPRYGPFPDQDTGRPQMPFPETPADQPRRFI